MSDECPDCLGNGGWFDGVEWIKCELCGGCDDPDAAEENL